MNPVPVFNQSFFAMGTRCEVVLVNPDTELAERAFLILQGIVSQGENLMSRFIPGTPLCMLNEGPAGQWLDVPDELWQVLVICRDFYEKSSGFFDVTSAPLILIWKNKPVDFTPAIEEIENARSKTGFSKVEFDTSHKRILKNAEGLQFDLGAIGKGIALDKMKSTLKELAIRQAFVSFGESSVMARGTHPAGAYWPVGIPNPFNPSEVIHIFEAKDHVVTTSGNLLNSSFHNAAIRQHIINPLTGYPVEGLKMVSVKSESATFGEFLSTTLLLLKPDAQKELLSKIKKTEILFMNFNSENELKKEFVIL